MDRRQGRHQARSRLPGGGRGQGQQVVDLAAALRPLPRAVRRPPEAAAADPPRPARAARLQRLALLLQQGRDRALGGPRLSGARLRLHPHAVRGVPVDRAARPAAPDRPPRAAGRRDRGSGRLPHRLHGNRGQGDRRRPGRGDRRRPAHARRGRLRRGLLPGPAAELRRPRRRLRARQLPRLRAVRARVPLERALGRRSGRPRGCARVRAAHRSRALRARPAAPSGRRRIHARRRARLRLARLPVHDVHARLELQRRAGGLPGRLLPAGGHLRPRSRRRVGPGRAEQVRPTAARAALRRRPRRSGEPGRSSSSCSASSSRRPS